MQYVGIRETRDCADRGEREEERVRPEGEGQVSDIGNLGGRTGADFSAVHYERRGNLLKRGVSRMFTSVEGTQRSSAESESDWRARTIRKFVQQYPNYPRPRPQSHNTVHQRTSMSHATCSENANEGAQIKQNGVICRIHVRQTGTYSSTSQQYLVVRVPVPPLLFSEGLL